MRHIRSYQELFETESGRQVYHVSRKPISAIGTTPMFFSLSLRDALGFFESALMDGLGAVLYSARISPTAKIAEDPESVLSDRGIDPDAYMAEIVANPSAESIMSLEGTEMLLSLGFAGMIYPEYDMFDTDEDTEALLIFRPQGLITDLTDLDGEALLSDLKGA
jgi:hypothetical protein